MSDIWDRTSFRPGHHTNYNDLKGADIALAVETEREDGKTGDGRGDAILDGAPKPMPGDELYDTLFRAKTEALERASYARQEPGQGYNSGSDYAAAIALMAVSQPQEQQDQARALEPQPVQQYAQEAAPRGPEQASPLGDRGNLNALKAEQAEFTPTPDLHRDFVDAETHATVAADRAQIQQQQRTRSMGLGM